MQKNSWKAIQGEVTDEWQNIREAQRRKNI